MLIEAVDIRINVSAEFENSLLVYLFTREAFSR
jgi:hypothetical protein